MGGTTGVSLEQGLGLTDISRGRPGRRPRDEVYSVRRVSDYLSSHIDLDDRIRTDMGCTQRDDGPNDVSNHHAPLSQGARNQPVYSKEQFIQENFRRYVYKRVLRGEGATANSRVILN